MRSFDPAAAPVSQLESGRFPCEDVGAYYAPADGLAGAPLKDALLRIIGGHAVVPYPQVWGALKLLDAADEDDPELSEDIIEIYRQRRAPKDMAAKPDGWNREHLWPRSYGLVAGHPEFSDLHNIRPADINVNSSRGNKWYGECSPVVDRACLQPANIEAAPDTATNHDVWTPPAQVRGDIARALLYMAVRYEGQDPNTFNLELSDKPSIAEARMGLLSILLRWSEQDPPSISEKMRNSRVCSLFQHNRNPFVDHPEYVQYLYTTMPPPDSLQRPSAKAQEALPYSPIGESAASTKARSTSPRSPGPSVPVTEAWINELHYDNVGKDKDEFVEVVVGPNVNLDSLVIYLYNGSNGLVYKTLPVAGFKAGQRTPRGQIVFVAQLPPDSIQNGPGDGVALVLRSGATLQPQVLQFVSYGGRLTAKGGPAKGHTSVDVGVQEGSKASPQSSIGLSGSGSKYSNFQWVRFGTSASPGLLNEHQVISPE
eukprot:SM000032S12099  [mRNA]  locus=s32:544543:547272:+ [translate_table: standard]